MKEIAIIGNYPEAGIDIARSSEDAERIGIGMEAAEYVCDHTGGTVSYIEPVGEVDIIM